ncbi:MAG: molybdenum cofactor guanylyltransferase [Ignavibacteriota bacterium]|jgi:molybdopterin-guanine dinucleotide biosynthesis protein A|nr:MAG: molybdenum cofactor guanylyltransferase [Chlorobiota bacterium]MBE7476846.1 molybdenum cofactor guanylyltransferase [Ignavibacteriales bacterium]MBL1121903.1 molybdenum cofactor guanylyltransferase [Ignavibacteriota bacterium]MCE7855562.1 molybdenum cofactor guanylyltransferase [Ignavibacteria bacterium CHB3]MCZ7613887.1 molybdenum cofactor guanylyltransferase [Ignavibacteriaceae bacterium]
MYKDITGIILAGGKSKRMGLNKSFLKVGEVTMIERTTELMKSLFDRVILITNTPDEYKFLGIEMFEDIYKNVGPLAGIHSGLAHSITDKNFIISCDIPFVNKGVIEFIINYKTNKSITITKADGFVQQLCGLYSKQDLQEIVELIEDDKLEINNSQKCGCKVLQLVQKLDAEIIDIANEYDGYEEGMFLNMNKPEDFELVRGRMNLSS